MIESITKQLTRRRAIVVDENISSDTSNKIVAGSFCHEENSLAKIASQLHLKAFPKFFHSKNIFKVRNSGQRSQKVKMEITQKYVLPI